MRFFERVPKLTVHFENPRFDDRVVRMLAFFQNSGLTFLKKFIQESNCKFRLYLNRITHGRVSLDVLAKGTTGFTGADIENMVNQAALKAATENQDQVFMRHLDEAKDRILMGPARLKGRIPNEETNRNTAYHEAGHAIVAHYTKDADPIHKVTIIQRGPSLGHVRKNFV